MSDSRGFDCLANVERRYQAIVLPVLVGTSASGSFLSLSSTTIEQTPYHVAALVVATGIALALAVTQTIQALLQEVATSLNQSG